MTPFHAHSPASTITNEFTILLHLCFHPLLHPALHPRLKIIKQKNVKFCGPLGVFCCLSSGSLEHKLNWQLGKTEEVPQKRPVIAKDTLTKHQHGHDKQRF